MSNSLQPNSMILANNLNRLIWAGFASLILLLSACDKREEVVIPNNEPPPDSTINNVTKENYVTRLYISILGRECSDAEFTEAYTILDESNLSVDARKQVIDLISAKPGYYERLFKIAQADFLNSSDSIDFIGQYYTYQLILQNQSLQAFWPTAQYEMGRIDLLMSTVADMKAGTINIVGMHKRCVNNYKYDEINMGSLNFVASMYQNFFYRYPTDAELDAGIQCVDGFPSTVFFQIASSKDQFIDLFFATDNYYEGQVRDLFKRYLFREPTSAEQTYFAERYKATQNYKALQKDILSLDEYVGI